MLFSVSISLLPHFAAQCIFFIINLIVAILFTLEYNKILTLMKVENKWHRFIFLFVISNGWWVYSMFYFGQFKYLIGVIFVFILRREIQYTQEEKEKDTKYYLIHYFLLVFVVGIAPYFVFFLLIYLFQDIRFNELFKKENVKNYFIIIMMFTIQNFLLIIYPSLIFEILYLNQDFNENWRSGYPLFYLYEWIILDDYSLIAIISPIVIFSITLIISFNKELKIEEKFAYFAFACILFYIYARRTFLVLSPLALLLFVPFLNQDEKGIDFFKKNKFLLIGILSVFIFHVNPQQSTIIKYFPILQEYPYIIFINLRWIFLLCIYVGSVVILYWKRYKSIANFKI